MKIVITGADGFIGKQLCKRFLKGNNIVGWDLFAKTYEGYEVIAVDMIDEKFIYNRILIDKPDLILHCAGSADVGKSISNPLNDYSRNVTATHNLLFSLKRAKYFNVRVLFFSSAAVYGNPSVLPITEKAMINPLSPYALHKVMCEEICQYFILNYNMDIKIVRIFSAYGPGLKKQIFWDMYNKLEQTHHLKMFGTGGESRDYIYISDLIEAIRLVATVSPKNEMLYNVANGVETTIKEVTEIFAEGYGISTKNILFSGEKKEGNPNNWKADISKLEALGYKKNVSLKMGIYKYIEWVNRGELLNK